MAEQPDRDLEGGRYEPEGLTTGRRWANLGRILALGSILLACEAQPVPRGSHRTSEQREQPGAPIMGDATHMPVMQLIQDPDQYDGKQVKVVGFCSHKFESSALYVSQADFRNAVTKNAVWLSFGRLDRSLEMHGKQVSVEGTFDMTDHGHGELYSGAIKNVTKIDVFVGPK
jgi:hypothetical protein